jgi:hypothetical protein
VRLLPLPPDAAGTAVEEDMLIITTWVAVVEEVAAALTLVAEEDAGVAAMTTVRVAEDAAATTVVRVEEVGVVAVEAFVPRTTGSKPPRKNRFSPREVRWTDPRGWPSDARVNKKRTRSVREKSRNVRKKTRCSKRVRKKKRSNDGRRSLGHSRRCVWAFAVSSLLLRCSILSLLSLSLTHTHTHTHTLLCYYA